MTEAQYQEILDRLTALEQDVAELKEAYQGLDSPSTATLLDQLSLLTERVSALESSLATTQTVVSEELANKLDKTAITLNDTTLNI